MKKSDTCYYMSITKEENSAFVVAEKQTDARPAIPKDTTACSLLSNEKKSGDAEEGSLQPKKPDGSNVVQYNLPQVILQAPSSSTPNASPSRINQANTVSSANLIVASCECHGLIYMKNRPNFLFYFYNFVFGLHFVWIVRTSYQLSVVTKYMQNILLFTVAKNKQYVNST